MNAWKNLHWIQKAIVGVFVLLMLATMPELMPLLDLGGIELIFGFIVLNIKTAKYWIHGKYLQTRDLVKSLLAAFVGCALAKPRNFVVHGGVCCAVLFFTGSILISSAFLLPMMLTNGYFV